MHAREYTPHRRTHAHKYTILVTHDTPDSQYLLLKT